MRSIVRDSKYRHVHGEASKDKFDDLRTSTKASEAYGIKANSKYFAVAWDSGGGGAIAPVMLTKPGRLPRDLPLITGHKGPVLDFDFNPFNDDQLASCGEDLTVKVWNLPEDGLKSHMKDAAVVLEGHGKKVTFCVFNPVADGILASCAFDLKSKIWNVDNQAESFSVDLPEQAWSLKWNWTGSLLALTSKDKKMHIVDPRAKSIVATTMIHNGSKGSKVQWIGSNNSGDDCRRIVTTGFTNEAAREIMVWDIRKFGDASKEEAEPLNILSLDNGTGALFPFFDDSTQTFWIAGKGDGNCRYFEYVPEDPYLHWISQFGNSTPQKGFAFLPKKSCNTKKHEIMRGLKLENTSVVPVSFTVPRKAEAFQEDIFPDCSAGVAATTADKWEGSTDELNPVLQSMRPGAASVAEGPKKAAPVSMKELKQQLTDAQARIESLEKENGLLKAEVAALKGTA